MSSSRLSSPSSSSLLCRFAVSRTRAVTCYIWITLVIIANRSTQRSALQVRYSQGISHVAVLRENGALLVLTQLVRGPVTWLLSIVRCLYQGPLMYVIKQGSRPYLLSAASSGVRILSSCSAADARVSSIYTARLLVRTYSLPSSSLASSPHCCCSFCSFWLLAIDPKHCARTRPGMC